MAIDNTTNTDETEDIVESPLIANPIRTRVSSNVTQSNDEFAMNNNESPLIVAPRTARDSSNVTQVSNFNRQPSPATPTSESEMTINRYYKYLRDYCKAEGEDTSQLLGLSVAFCFRLMVCFLRAENENMNLIRYAEILGNYNDNVIPAVRDEYCPDHYSVEESMELYVESAKRFLMRTHRSLRQSFVFDIKRPVTNLCEQWEDEVENTKLKFLKVGVIVAISENV